MHELDLELKELVIKSPITGMVTAIHYQPGQIVPEGEPILAVSDPIGKYIISYVRQDQRLNPVVKGTVYVRGMAQNSPQMKTFVTKVGARIEKVPLHQRRDSRRTEWGLPVKIEIPTGLKLRPGELLDVAFKTKTSFFTTN